MYELILYFTTFITKQRIERRLKLIEQIEKTDLYFNKLK